jgi:transposase InsO family protein
MSNLMQEITQRYQITHMKSTPYHPQANGQVESTNKVLETILTKTMQLHKKDWSDRIMEALWAYITTWRSTNGFSPYDWSMGKQVLLPIEFQIKTFKMATDLGMDLTEATKDCTIE